MRKERFPFHFFTKTVVFTFSNVLSDLQEFIDIICSMAMERRNTKCTLKTKSLNNTFGIRAALYTLEQSNSMLQISSCTHHYRMETEAIGGVDRDVRNVDSGY